MRRTVASALVAIMLITAGCNGFLDSGNSTNVGTPGTAPNTTDPGTTTTAPSLTPTPSPQEQEYLRSGKEFTRVMGIRMNNTHGMFFTDRGFYRNNTVSMTYRLGQGTPLYKSMMNATQTVSVIIPTRTTTDEKVAMGNGREGKIHRPEMVYIRIVDHNGNRIGSFEIDPDTAYKYRRYELDGDVFAQNIVDTLNLEQDVERGDRSPVWYLNRSQLYDWTFRYAGVLRQETDPSETSFEKEFSLVGLDIKPGEMVVHYETEWDNVEMGQAAISGQAAIYDSYYITTDKAWAMAPRRLSHYFHVPGGDDIRSHMDLSSVMWLLRKDNPRDYKNEYFQMAETEIIEDE